MATITWNPKIKLILADVDETIADVYTDATPTMIEELNKLLQQDVVLFLVSGGGLQSIMDRVINKVTAELRHKLLVAHCSGAEVWGFDKTGGINNLPHYGLYDQKMSDEQKVEWRKIVDVIIKKYQLKLFETMPPDEFVKQSKGNLLAVMYVDRGPQITFEFTNSIDLSETQKCEIENKLSIQIPKHEGTYDLRIPVMEELANLYKKHRLPVVAKFGGIFALDNPLEGVDKTLAIDYVLQNNDLLREMGLPEDILNRPESMEIWGDKFNQKKGGSDFNMCKAVPKSVRTIDFRLEDYDGMQEGYNIQIWDGEKHLHEGLLEYLQTK